MLYCADVQMQQLDGGSSWAYASNVSDDYRRTKTDFFKWMLKFYLIDNKE